MIVIEIYFDDIIFGSDDDILSQNFANDMTNEFEISLHVELTLLLEMHISLLDEVIFISQTK